MKGWFASKDSQSWNQRKRLRLDFKFLVGQKGQMLSEGHPGEEFATHVGLPQGSVISPILFNIFLQDISCQKVKSADDGTVWPFFMGIRGES